MSDAERRGVDWVRDRWPRIRSGRRRCGIRREKRRIVAFLQIDFNFTVLKGEIDFCRTWDGSRAGALQMPGARVRYRGRGLFFFFCFPRINKIYRCFRLQLVMPPEHICVRIGAAREWPRETMLWRADREKKKIQIIAHAIRVIRVPDGSRTTSRCRDRTSCRLGRMHRRLHPNCVPTTTTKNKFVFIEMFLKILYGIY